MAAVVPQINGRRTVVEAHPQLATAIGVQEVRIVLQAIRVDLPGEADTFSPERRTVWRIGVAITD